MMGCLCTIEDLPPMSELYWQGNDRFESRHRRKDGSVYDVVVRTVPIGRGWAVSVLILDISGAERFGC